MSPTKRIFALPTRPPRACVLLYLGARELEVAILAGRGAAAWDDGAALIAPFKGVASGEPPLPGLLAALDAAAQFAVPPRAELRVVVADCWLAQASLPWSARLAHAASAQAYARSCLAAAGFDSDAFAAPMIDDAPFRSVRLAFAYPTLLLAALDELARRWNARLASVLPLSIGAWAALRQTGARAPALAVADGGLVLAMRSAGPGDRRCCDITVRATGADETHAGDAARDLWRRLCLREPSLDALDHVAVLDLTRKAPETPPAGSRFFSLDLPANAAARQPSARIALVASARELRHPLDARLAAAVSAPWCWLALLAIAVVCSLLVLDAVQTHTAVRAALATMEAGQGAPQSVPEPVWSRDELPRVQAVNAAIRELNLPLAALLHALEPASDIRVAVLGVEAMSHGGNAEPTAVKITAEAPTSADMARYVAFVAARRPFTGAVLTMHEVDLSASERPYRFALEASWAH